jgi:hypothetical protein
VAAVDLFSAGFVLSASPSRLALGVVSSTKDDRAALFRLFYLETMEQDFQHYRNSSLILNPSVGG